MPSRTPPRVSYHHGSLPKVLIAKGAQLLAEQGIERFSTREVARRAGVAAAAPAHHFGNSKGLLTAIATAGFSRLAARLEVAANASRDPEDQIIAMCRAYVEMASTDPGYALIMFRLDLLNDTDERFRDQSFHAFNLFKTAISRAASEVVEPSQVGSAAKTLWAAMHGLVALHMIEEQEAEELVRFAVHTLIAGIR